MAAIALAGCPSAEPLPEPEPPGPEEVWLGEPVGAHAEVLLEGDVTFAAALPGWRVIAEVDGALVTLDPLDVEPASHGADTGPVSSVVPLPGDATLIAADEGLFTLHDWGLAPSPLGEVWAPTGDAQLLGAGDDLWIADGDGLHLWRSGDLFSVSAGELPTADARIAWGSPVQGFGALWLAADDLVYALVEQGDGFVTWEEAGALDAIALSVDGVDDLWAILSGGGDPDWGFAGDVRRRLPDGTWQWFRLPATPREVATGPSADVWFRTDEEQPRLILQSLDFWSDVQVDGASPLGPDDRFAGIDPAGRLLIYGPSGLRRVSVERPMVFLGLEEGDAVEEVTTVTMVPTLADRATDLGASLDGAPVEAVATTLGDRTVWSLTLDPVDLSDGAHELTVTTSWDDGAEPVEQSLFFSAGAFDPPTWEDDMVPLNDRHCTRCHTANGGAHLLDTRARWEDEIDEIIDNVISGAMPLSGDKLDADEIRTIELWRAGGFLE